MNDNVPAYIVVHCSDSEWGTPDDIERWHTAPKPAGNGWSTIGYHYVVQNGKTSSKAAYKRELDGYVANTLPETSVGIHTPALNRASIAVCLVGRTTFSRAQKQALIALCTNLCTRYKIGSSKVIGHYESPTELAKGSSAKTCPNMKMDTVRAAVHNLVEAIDDAAELIK